MGMRVFLAGATGVLGRGLAIPVKSQPRPEDWASNDRIRREGTRALTQAAARVGAGTYLQQGITWVARPPDGSAFDEHSPPHPDAVTRSALDGERIALETGQRTGMAVGVLRCG